MRYNGILQRRRAVELIAVGVLGVVGGLWWSSQFKAKDDLDWIPVVISLGEMADLIDDAVVERYACDQLLRILEWESHASPFVEYFVSAEWKRQLEASDYESPLIAARIRPASVADYRVITMNGYRQHERRTAADVTESWLTLAEWRSQVKRDLDRNCQPEGTP